MKKTLLASALLLALGNGIAIADTLEPINEDYYEIKSLDKADSDWVINVKKDPYYGYGVSVKAATVNIGNLTVNSEGGGIHTLGSNSGLTINAKNVTINNNNLAAFYAGNAANSTITLNVDNQLKVRGAQLAAVGLYDKAINIEAGVVDAELSRMAMLSYGNLNIKAKSIDIHSQAELLLKNYGSIFLEATNGDLNLTGNILNAASKSDISTADVVSLIGKNITVNGDLISKVENSTSTEYDKKQTHESTISIETAGKAVINGNIAIAETNVLNLIGNLVFAGDEAEIAKLTAEAKKRTAPVKSTFTITKAGQKVHIGNNEIADLTIAATGDVNDKLGGEVDNLIGGKSALVKIDKGTKNIAVVMAEGMGAGEITAKLNDDGTVNEKSVVTKTNSIMSNTLDIASAAPLAMNRLLMNDVRKRMGDLRSAEGTHGVWARYDGGKLSGEAGLENDFTTIQVGIDTVPVVDAPRFGVAFSYTTSDTDMKRGGAEMDAFGLAFYGTKMYDNGMFVDVIGRMATADSDVTVDGNKKGTMDNIALSLSGEFGWRFDVTDQFFVEPQAELTYTYVNADTLTLSNGSAYDFDSVDSLMGRVGFVAGFKCPADFGNVYVRASAVHEFLGDAAVRAGTFVHEIDGEDTWVEYGIGANFNINKNTYVYADIERTEGAKLEEDWRANVGVRFAF